MDVILEKAEKISNILKNFSNKNKLAILCFLWKDKKNVSEILQNCNMSQSQVSQFLNKMKLEKILDCEKKWKEVYYYITNNDTLKIINILKENFL